MFAGNAADSFEEERAADYATERSNLEGAGVITQRALGTRGSVQIAPHFYIFLAHSICFVSSLASLLTGALLSWKLV